MIQVEISIVSEGLLNSLRQTSMDSTQHTGQVVNLLQPTIMDKILPSICNKVQYFQLYLLS